MFTQFLSWRMQAYIWLGVTVTWGFLYAFSGEGLVIAILGGLVFLASMWMHLCKKKG